MRSGGIYTVAYVLSVTQLEHKKSFLYVDSESIKFLLIRGAFENSRVDLLAKSFAEYECNT